MVKTELAYDYFINYSFFFLQKWGTGYYDTKREIKVLSDSIRQKDLEINLLENLVMVSRELSDAAIFDADLIRDSARIEKENSDKQKQYYEWKIANLKNVPTDTLYLDFIQWIDTVSFD